MFKHLLTILVALMLWVPNFASAADPKVAFIYVGPVGDGGWTYAVSYTHLTLPTTLQV